MMDNDIRLGYRAAFNYIAHNTNIDYAVGLEYEIGEVEVLLEAYRLALKNGDSQIASVVTKTMKLMETYNV